MRPHDANATANTDDENLDPADRYAMNCAPVDGKKRFGPKLPPKRPKHRPAKKSRSEAA